MSVHVVLTRKAVTSLAASLLAISVLLVLVALARAQQAPPSSSEKSNVACLGS